MSYGRVLKTRPQNLFFVVEEGRNVDLTSNKKEGKCVLAVKFLTRRTVNIKVVARTF